MPPDPGWAVLWQKFGSLVLLRGLSVSVALALDVVFVGGSEGSVVVAEEVADAAAR